MILGHQEITFYHALSICSLFLCHQIMHLLGFFNTTLALHEHAYLFLIYEKCNVDRVGKMPSNKTVSSDFKSFLSLIVNDVSINLHR